MDITDLIELCGFDTDENDFMCMDDYDHCFVGVIERYGQAPIVCYDKDKVLAKLVSDGMTYEGAIEFFEFNQLGAWVGDSTPAFITMVPRDSLKDTGESFGDMDIQTMYEMDEDGY